MTTEAECRTQADLDRVLGTDDYPVLVGNGYFELSTSRLVYVEGSSAPSIVTRGSSAPRIDTRDSSAPSIDTWGSSAPSIVTWDSSAPRIVTRDSSAPSIDTRGSSAPSIVTRGSSAPRIDTRDSSAPSIDTWGSSAPRIDTWDSSAPRARADHSQLVTTHGTATTVTHTPNITVDGDGHTVLITPNRPLFVKVLTQIELHPDTWDQSVWAKATDCGSAFCMAGWSCQLDGKTIDVGSQIVAGTRREISYEAAWSLGISEELGLFSGENTLDDLYRISAELLGDEDDSALRSEVALAAIVPVQP